MKNFTLLLIFFYLVLTAVAQAPQSLKYQAVARDGSGNILVNKTVSFRISILSNSSSGTVVYSESHTGKTSNAFGLVELEIGKGSVISGAFAAIPWGSTNYFVRIEMDPAGGSSWQAMGTSQLLSVPYALYANDVKNNDDADADPANELQKISISGTVLTLDKNGGSVTLPSSGTGGDNWGTQSVVTDGTLSGSGTTAAPLKIADNGVTSGKILDGAISSADLADNAVTTLKIANGGVTSDKLALNAVVTDKINAGAVTGVKIAQAGATAGQALKWNGTTWAPADDATGGGGFSLPYAGTANDPVAAFKVTNSNTTNEAAGLYGYSSSSSGSGVRGLADNTSGNNYGVFGSSTSPGGTGVYGKAPNFGVMGFSTTAEGLNYGVIGETFSTGGNGVYGHNGASTGTNYGVHGVTLSTEGYGVYGEAPNYGVFGKATTTVGANNGIKGETSSPAGIGVLGKNNATGDVAVGVEGVSASASGIGVSGQAPRVGVQGDATSLTGSNFGVVGQTNSPDGTGVSGWAYAGSGNSYGVYGYTNSTSGFGVRGRAAATTGTNCGVFGLSGSSSGAGVKGESPGTGVEGNSTSTSGTNYGVHGTTLSPNGIGVSGEGPSYGVRGVANGASSQSVGVYGESSKSSGIGVQGVSSFSGGTAVFGYYNLLSGNGIGVKGFSSSSTGYSGYFSGGKFYVDHGVGVGTASIRDNAGIDLVGSGFPSSFMYFEAPAGQDAGIRLYEGGTAKWHIFNSSGAGGLHVYNTGGTTAIFCKQSNSFVGINTTTPAFTLEVNGTAGKTGGGSWSTSSDIRLKNISGNYNKGLSEIMALRPVRFTYKEGNPRNLPSDEEQTGFIAQEVQKVFPEAVNEGNDGYLDFNIHPVNVAVVNAIKELKAENDILKAQLGKLEARLEKMEAIFSAKADKSF